MAGGLEKDMNFYTDECNFNSYLSVNEENHIQLGKRSEINHPFPSYESISNEKLGDHW